MWGSHRFIVPPSIEHNLAILVRVNAFDRGNIVALAAARRPNRDLEGTDTPSSRGERLARSEAKRAGVLDAPYHSLKSVPALR